MKQEYVFIAIIGLFVFAYVLDTVVAPLPISLVTPYQYFTPQTVTRYPFTTVSIVVKTIGLFLIPLWLMSFFTISKLAKGAISLTLSALMQLYALQDIATNTRRLPLEWSLALALTGLVLLVPTVLYILAGGVHSVINLFKDPYDMPDDQL